MLAVLSFNLLVKAWRDCLEPRRGQATLEML
jgi:hypothetical protein